MKIRSVKLKITDTSEKSVLIKNIDCMFSRIAS